MKNQIRESKDFWRNIEPTDFRGKEKGGLFVFGIKKLVSAGPCPLRERKSKCVDIVKKAEVFASFSVLVLEKEEDIHTRMIKYCSGKWVTKHGFNRQARDMAL